MKSLLILRHAKSSWDSAYLADHERPLNERGKADAPRIGRLLQSEELVPDLIISSSAARALATAKLVAGNCDYENEIVVTRDFYHADPEIYLEVLATLDDRYQRVMVVGHNPGMEELVEELTGEFVRMATAALAHVALHVDRWQDVAPEATVELKAQLKATWLPKEL
ncbi:MAG: histidine phosphatase family protein [Chloroflexi bacterium]|nr:histidine phosphatase family protein [Chloroflexota bacterium]